jgi:mannose-6-phosphate isomerase-like protein (cupin superfamily)
MGIGEEGETPMQIVTVGARVRFADEKMQKVGLFATERFFFDLYCLKPGQAQKVHSHGGSDKVYYVLSGRATVRVGAEQQELAPGQAALAPSGQEHGVTNAGKEPLTLLVFMAPCPAH